METSARLAGLGPRFRRRALRGDVNRVGNSVSGSLVPAVALVQDTVRLEQLPIHRTPFRQTLPLWTDRPAVVRQRGGALAPGRELVLTIRRVE